MVATEDQPRTRERIIVELRRTVLHARLVRRVAGAGSPFYAKAHGYIDFLLYELMGDWS